MGAIASTDADEQAHVCFFRDGETGLRGITVLDDLRLGPAVGACRTRRYDDEDRALADALRQARTTTLKAVMAGLPFGGGCTVLLDDREEVRGISPFGSLGRMVDDLGGRYFLMPEIGTAAADMDKAAEETAHVLGQSSHEVLDPGEATAAGVCKGIEAAVGRRLGLADLGGVHVALLGLGPAGFRLAELLRQQGAKLTVADRDPRRTERAVRELGIACVTTEEIVHLNVDIFAPCAGQNIIDEDSLSHLRCSIVAGTADNFLKMPALGQRLHERGILYLPDYTLSAGGLISLGSSLIPDASDRPSIERRISFIGDRLIEIIDRSEREQQPTCAVAEQIALARLADRVSSGDANDVAMAC
ncbi:MAG: Glu/Leu/Phe/Val dehydrogenase dimerization domain-containing protein [Geminicoccaceae bacterium]